jgi:Protein of unknown function (DUF3048) N-terminal domain/Protein of unknown function (DUF3048) C-terminal domain
MRPPVLAGLAMLALVGVIALSVLVAGTSPGSAQASGGVPVAARSGEPPAPGNSTPTAEPSASPTPSPSPSPTPVLLPAPLTGRLVSPEVAARRPIAVMIDDLRAARPQSGFGAASVVWQAPAEGGIPRYMLVFQDQLPGDVGPVRSARYYYITWAAEWHAVYAHVGGSPQAMATLASQGQGQLVYNADEFRWGGIYFRRITDRASPHNAYSDGISLRKMATRIGAKDELQPAAWQFAPDVPLDARPYGGLIRVSYPANTITYRYDRITNTYPRGVTGAPAQIDASTGQRVAPSNVVIMLMSFAPLNDGHPTKHRLEAKVVGSGKAWISTNGRTIQGTWKKASLTAPTQFFDAAGEAVTLTVGQTFIQVMPLGSKVTIQDGTATPPSPSASPLESPGSSPSPS